MTGFVGQIPDFVAPVFNPHLIPVLDFTLLLPFPSALPYTPNPPTHTPPPLRPLSSTRPHSTGFSKRLPCHIISHARKRTHTAGQMQAQAPAYVPLNEWAMHMHMRGDNTHTHTHSESKVTLVGKRGPIGRGEKVGRRRSKTSRDTHLKKKKKKFKLN